MPRSDVVYPPACVCDSMRKWIAAGFYHTGGERARGLDGA